MAYYHVSGVNVAPSYTAGNSDIFGCEVGKHGKGKAKVKKAFKKIGPGKLLMKVGGAPGRNAFLELMKLNAFNLAKRLVEHGQTAQGKSQIQSLWRKVGGKWKNFAKNANHGYQAALHRRKQTMPATMHLLAGVDMGGEMGIVSDFAAYMAAAAPVLLAFSGLLKQLGINPADVAQQQQQGLKQIAKLHNASDKGMHPDGTETDLTTLPDGTQELTMKSHKGNKLDSEDVSDGSDNLGPAGQPYASPGFATPASGGMLPSPDVEEDVADKEAEKKASEELPDTTSTPGTAVNVVTDWADGLKNFVVQNKGLTITVVSVTGVILLANSRLFHSVKGRK